jgi:hypothetical protein
MAYNGSFGNPQSNAIKKRIHLTIGNIICTIEIQSNEDLDNIKPWSGNLSATMLLSENLSILLSKPHKRTWYLEEMQL